jgi:hypothetical protein
MAAKSDKPRFVVRTVRHGQVTIHGRAYAPSQRHMAYDGRLEELRFAFGRYPHDPHVVALWGSHDAYQASRRTASPADLARYERGQCDCPEAVDGSLPWMFWHEVHP